MADYELKLSGASVVLVGSFNPAIFQPEWFARNGLLPQGEVDSAEMQVIHPQLCQFETERFTFQITTDRFTGMTKPNTIADPLRDLILGTFFVLEHTPVTAMGMNRMLHFAFPNEEAWHRLGDKLAPKAPWKGILEGRPGMRNLEIITFRETPKGSSVMVKIQPSVLVPLGVYFEVNDHNLASEGTGLKSLMEILRGEWESSQKKGDEIARHILDWAAAEG
jgi:hypothetical protein